jgi:hypothetical protein
MEKEREEKQKQLDEMERLKTWEKGREVRVDSWKDFKTEDKNLRPVVRGGRACPVCSPFAGGPAPFSFCGIVCAMCANVWGVWGAVFSLRG